VTIIGNLRRLINDMNIQKAVSSQSGLLKWGMTLLMVIVCLSSCISGKIANENEVINPAGWSIADSIAFTVMVEDTVQAVDFYVNIRNKTSYRYSNLILFLDTRFPDGRTSRDTLECFLARPDGEWTGSGIGNRKQNTLLLKRNVIFPASGSYTFVFRQAMRDNPLMGISDLGITIQNTEAPE